MPELPEVEVLVRYLDPILKGKVIRGVKVHRAKSIRPTVVGTFSKRLTGSKILGVRRRAKYLLFNLSKGDSKPYILLGHLGMTGRMYVQRAGQGLPKHAAVSFRLNRGEFVFEDTRYFGRMTLETDVMNKLGPEPLSEGFNGEVLFEQRDVEVTNHSSVFLGPREICFHGAELFVKIAILQQPANLRPGYHRCTGTLAVVQCLEVQRLLCRKIP